MLPWQINQSTLWKIGELEVKEHNDGSKQRPHQCRGFVWKIRPCLMFATARLRLMWSPRTEIYDLILNHHKVKRNSFPLFTSAMLRWVFCMQIRFNSLALCRLNNFACSSVFYSNWNEKNISHNSDLVRESFLCWLTIGFFFGGNENCWWGRRMLVAELFDVLKSKVRWKLLGNF